MKAFNWLSRLRNDTAGNVLAIGAAAMPLMIAAAAIGVDTIRISLARTQLQRSADSSALAGAHALVQNADATRAATRAVALNTTLTPDTTQVQNAPSTGAFAGDTSAVRVVLTARRTVPFMAFFGVAQPNVQVEATARIDTPGDFCMLSLYEGTAAGIDVNGGADVTLGCGMAANARGTSSITSGGNSTITADPIMAVGGIASGQNFVGNPDILPYGTKQKDPFANVPNPTVPSNCGGALRENNVPTVAGTYCYSSIDIGPQGSVTFPEGSKIIVNGGDVDIKGNFTAYKTVILMTGPNGAAGDVKINSQANLKLTPPDSGDYKGIIFFRDRRASNIEITINGGAASLLEGALYFPTSDIKFAGHASMDVKCLQMVGQILKFRGSANVTNVCPPGSGASDFTGRNVRLVA